MPTELILFLIMAVIAVTSALGMLFSRSAVYAALFLVLNFGTVAVFYVLLKEILSLKLVELHLMVFGILFILVVLFLPGGFVQAWKQIQRLVGRWSVSKKV